MLHLECLRHYIKCHNRGERGFTLIEAVVSMALFTIAIVPLGQLFYGDLSTSVAASRRSEAVGLATEQLAAVRALPYGEIGFYSNQASGSMGYGAACNRVAPNFEAETSPVVVLGATAPSNDDLTPVAVRSVGSFTYTVYTCISWAESPASQPMYKRVFVTVSWQDATGSASLTQASLIYDTGGGLSAISSSTGLSSSSTSSTSNSESGSKEPNDSQESEAEGS